MKASPSTQRLSEGKTIKKEKNLKTLPDFPYLPIKKRDLTYPFFRKALVKCVCDPKEFETNEIVLLLADGSSIQIFRLLGLRINKFCYDEQSCPSEKKELWLILGFLTHLMFSAPQRQREKKFSDQIEPCKKCDTDEFLDPPFSDIDELDNYLYRMAENNWPAALRVLFHSYEVI